MLPKVPFTYWSVMQRHITDPVKNPNDTVCVS